MKLQRWAYGGVFITAVMIGLTGFITTGIAEYGVTDNVENGEMQKLEDIQESTSIAQDAQERAEQAEARSNFFTLPNIVNLLRLPFEAIPVWEEFISVAMDVTGINNAPQNWPMMMASSFLVITVAFKFAQRVL